MPQAATPKQDEQAKQGENGKAQDTGPLFDYDSLIDDTSAGRMIARACQLEAEIEEQRVSIGKNRDYLRLMDANDELSDEQSEWLDTFYPEKEKGARRDKDEIEATRKAREEARKRVATAS